MEHRHRIEAVVCQPIEVPLRRDMISNDIEVDVNRLKQRLADGEIALIDGKIMPPDAAPAPEQEASS